MLQSKPEILCTGGRSSMYGFSKKDNKKTKQQQQQ